MSVDVLVAFMCYLDVKLSIIICCNIPGLVASEVFILPEKCT